MSPKRKLTLSIDEEVIRRAKRFTAERETSISRLVEAFLSRLGRTGPGDTPLVDGLRGVLPSDTELEEYRRHLDEKYGR